MLDNPDQRGLVITDTQALAELAGQLQVPYISKLNGTIQFEDPALLHRDESWKRYLQERDQFALLGRNDASRMAWMGVSTSLVWELHKGTFGTYRWCQIMRIAFDKHWTKQNQAKRVQQNPDLRCPWCDKGNEDQEHIIWHCSHPTMCAMRHLSVGKLMEAAEQLTLHPPNPTRDFLLRLHPVLLLPANYSFAYMRCNARD